MDATVEHNSAKAPTGRIERLLAAAFSPTILFVVALDTILFHNLEDLGYEVRVVATFATAFVLATAACVLWLARFERAGRELIARFAFVPGFWVLAIDSAAWWSQRPDVSAASAAAMDAAAVGVAVLLLLLPPLPVLSKFLAAVTAVTLVQQAIPHLQYAARASDESRTTATKTVDTAAREHGNVYHILLDGFQREVYEKLKSADASLALPGFRYFSRFTSQYGFTMYSVPNLLHGRRYLEDESFHDWQSHAPTEGFWKELDEAGVTVELYPHWDSYCSPNVALCHSNQRMLRELGGATSSRTIVDLWFLGLVPGSSRKSMLEKLAAQDAAATGTATLANLPGTFEPPPAAAREHTWGAGEHHPLTRAFSLTTFLMPRAAVLERKFAENEKLASLANVDRFLARESDQPGHGRYVFVHVNAPHPPFFLDGDCRPKAPEPMKIGPAADAAFIAMILDQSTCAMRIATRILERLDALGRLDDATVIFHSDHGHDPKYSPRLLAAFPELFTVEWDNAGDQGEFMRTPKTIGLRSHALLLVKTPNASAFSQSDARAQMIDIAPTVLRHYGIGTGRFAGWTLQDLPEPLPEREVTFDGGEPWQEFFSGGGRDSIFPSGNRFSEFVLDEGRWRYERDIPVH